MSQLKFISLLSVGGLEGNAVTNVVGRSNIARARSEGVLNYRISVGVPIYICSGGGDSEPFDTVASGGLYHERLMIDESGEFAE